MNTKHIRKTAGVLLGLVLALGFAATAYAHGVMIDYTVKSNGEIELQAAFDTGEVMNEAAVTIYSPDDPANPWLTGTADAEGRFVFTVDPEMVGTWAVQFRKAGHGDIVHIPIEAGMLDAPAVEAGAAGMVENTETDAAADTAPVAGMAVDEASEVDAAPAIENEAESVAPAEAEQEMAHNNRDSSIVEVQPSLADDQESTAPDVAEPPVEAAPAQAARVISSGGNVGGGGGFTTFQIILMSASVIWGFVGTALYFSNRPGEHVH